MAANMVSPNMAGVRLLWTLATVVHDRLDGDHYSFAHSAASSLALATISRRYRGYQPGSASQWTEGRRRQREHER
jgi:hypothetical protein